MMRRTLGLSTAKTATDVLRSFVLRSSLALAHNLLFGKFLHLNVRW